MANSAGGRIIYGVSEYNELGKNHLPEKIDPVDLKIYSKEWLEQVISSNISPKIPNLTITPVPIDTHTAVFVVEVPQSVLGHQANDKRYYKRHNFESTAMEDYELKDILNRQIHPDLELHFSLEYDFQIHPHPDQPLVQHCCLKCRIDNIGSILAEFVNVRVTVPAAFTLRNGPQRKSVPEIFNYTNMVRDKINSNELGPARNATLLPKLSHSQSSYTEYRIAGQPYNYADEIEFQWAIYADSATPKNGSTLVRTSIEKNERTDNHIRISTIPRELDENDRALPLNRG